MPDFTDDVEALRARILQDLLAAHGGITAGQIRFYLRRWGYQGREDAGWTFLFQMAKAHFVFAHRRYRNEGDDIVYLVEDGWRWLQEQPVWEETAAVREALRLDIARAIILGRHKGPAGQGRLLRGSSLVEITKILLRHLERIRDLPDSDIPIPLINNAAQVRGQLALAQIDGWAATVKPAPGVVEIRLPRWPAGPHAAEPGRQPDEAAAVFAAGDTASNVTSIGDHPRWPSATAPPDPQQLPNGPGH